MSQSNQKTIASYDEHIQEYIEGTPQTVSGDFKQWLVAALAGLARGARILEIGSGFGRDAAYIESLGYKVQRTDGTPGFVKWLKQHGQEARILDALTDDIPGPYDLIFADAVLLHFTREETKAVIGKVFAALSEGGRFAFSLKQGEGETWTAEKLGAPRYFCFWTKETIEQMLAQAGFQNITTKEATNNKKVAWLLITVTKPQ